MKIRNKIIISMCIICLAALLFACSDKTPKTAEYFENTMTDGGFTVKDVTAIADIGEHSNVSLIAKNGKYQIEFYDLKSDFVGKNAFVASQKAFENECDTNSTSSVSASNYDIYRATTDTDFFVLSRIGNTLVYCKADKQYKNEISEWIDKLGYGND